MCCKNAGYIGRFVETALPKIAEMALRQKQVPKILSDYSNIGLLFEAFSEYNDINFKQYLESTKGHGGTESRMQFVAVFFYCFDPEVIYGPCYKRIDRRTRIYLSEQLHMNACVVSHYLPKIRFYMARLAGYEHEVMKIISVVKSKLEAYKQ